MVDCNTSTVAITTLNNCSNGSDSVLPDINTLLSSDPNVTSNGLIDRRLSSSQLLEPEDELSVEHQLKILYNNCSLNDEVDSDTEDKRELKRSTERDLVLAARLGSGLVSENDRLKSELESVRRECETLRQDCLSVTAQLERREEELKSLEESHREELHKLSTRLKREEAEHECRVSELEGEVERAREDVEHRVGRWSVREKSLVEEMEELRVENERLAEELLESSRLETDVRSTLQLQVAQSESSEDEHQRELADYGAELDELRHEMAVKVRLKTDECSILSRELCAAQEKIKQLETNASKHGEEIQQLNKETADQADEIRRLEEVNSGLSSRLESISASAAPGAVSQVRGETSLFAELELISDSMSSHAGQQPYLGQQQPGGRVTVGTQLRQEVLEVYRQLDRLLQESEGKDWSPEAVGLDQLKAGDLLLRITELRTVLYERTSALSDDSDVKRCGAVVIGDLSYVADLRRQLASARDQLADVTRKLQTAEQQLSSHDEELERARAELSSCQQRLDNMKSELDKSRALVDECRDRGLNSSSETPQRDDVITELRRERDAALDRLYQLEGELTRAHLDVTYLNKQLLDACDQKLRLSQQLEAWQSDMHELIESRMNDEIARDRSGSSSTTRDRGGSSASSTSSRRQTGNVPRSTGADNGGGGRKFTLWN